MTMPEPGPIRVVVMLTREQIEAAIYALRCEAHRQEPSTYPDHTPRFPDYDPWPSDMAKLADELERELKAQDQP
jgi:hypothetical protein